MNKLWGGPQAPAIAIVDSGIDTSHASFAGGRVVARQAFAWLGQLARRPWAWNVRRLDRGRQRTRYAGAAPNAKLIDLDVMDDNGVGRPAT